MAASAAGGTAIKRSLSRSEKSWLLFVFLVFRSVCTAIFFSLAAAATICADVSLCAEVSSRSASFNLKMRRPAEKFETPRAQNDQGLPLTSRFSVQLAKQNFLKRLRVALLGRKKAARRSGTQEYLGGSGPHIRWNWNHDWIREAEPKPLATPALCRHGLRDPGRSPLFPCLRSRGCSPPLSASRC